MNTEEFRHQMDSYRARVDAEARDLKDSQYALRELFGLYRGLDKDERRMACTVLSDWLHSDDEAVRFDALAVVDEFAITAVTPALKELSQRLRSSSSPGAPFELEKVDRIITKLSPA